TAGPPCSSAFARSAVPRQSIGLQVRRQGGASPSQPTKSGPSPGWGWAPSACEGTIPHAGSVPGANVMFAIDTQQIHSAVETSLTWIGFGVVSGLLAKGILPGRDPGGTIVTGILGLSGALIGASIYAWAGGERIEDLISLEGFAISVGG